MLNKHFMSIPIIKSTFKKGISWGELLSHFSFVICSLSATLIRPETTHYSLYILFCHFAGKSCLVSNLLSGAIFSFGSGHSLDPSLPAKTEQVNPSPYPLSHCRGQRHSPALQIATLESFYTFSSAFLLLYQIFHQSLTIFLLSAVMWFTPSSPSRFSGPITCYYNSFLVGLPDSNYSPASQHSLAGISSHRYHLYHMHLYLKIGNGIKYESFSIFSKSTQELFTTLLSQQPVPPSLAPSHPPSFPFYLSTSPLSLVSLLKFPLKPHLACCVHCVTCYFQRSGPLQMPFPPVGNTFCPYDCLYPAVSTSKNMT